ncbi:hypothetical protein IT568_09655 [bacterium]|nr:hypothetical protein [bacterium]
MDWNFIVTIAGFGLTILGLYLNLRQLKKTKDAALASLESSKETKKLLQQNSLLIETSTCVKLTEQIKGFVRGEKFESALLKIEELMVFLIQVESLKKLDLSLGKQILQLQILRRELEKRLGGETENYNKHLVLNELSKISDKLNEVIGNLKFKTGGKK